MMGQLTSDNHKRKGQRGTQLKCIGELTGAPNTMWPLSHVTIGVGGGAWWGGNCPGSLSMTRSMTAGPGGAVLTWR